MPHTRISPHRSRPGHSPGPAPTPGTGSAPAPGAAPGDSSTPRTRRTLVTAPAALAAAVLTALAAVGAAAPQAAAAPQPRFVTAEQCEQAGGRVAVALGARTVCEGGRYAALPVASYTAEPMITPAQCTKGGGRLPARAVLRAYRCDGGEHGGRLVLRPEGRRIGLTWRECVSAGGSPVTDPEGFFAPPLRPYCSGGRYHGVVFLHDRTQKDAWWHLIGKS
ncbi:hypothetical protein [Streptomyces sp. JJ36]|uniref:hypothetical protein n=1 Tax=Streptomyces sp. JJ36 TaxID=2736645 RepID=UPI001F1ED191|nr:hypothetical protein [Streptomyces sp. JJ36]MCF6524826.1 hypothetical protein [Streptomyces sp. JJ36]